MEVQSDVYVKFGEDAEDARLPQFDGDSTDAAHTNWSELRSCNFGLSRENAGTPGDDAGDVKKTGGKKKIEKVTFTKKVDWASPNLFLKCCIAKMKDVPPDWKLEPKIKKVRVEVCRTAGGKKFPFVIIVYNDVIVTSYTISMSGAEAQETLELEVDSFRYGFRRTNAFTGEPEIRYDPKNPDSGVQWEESGSTADDAGPQSQDHQEDDEGTSAEGGAAAAAAAAGVAAAGATSGNGSTSALVSTHDSAVRSTFPGLRDGNGFGLLPD
jgi:type VI protein secretion system component Hcp